MLRIFCVAIFVLVIGCAPPAFAAASKHDPRPLSTAEIETFLPLVCDKFTLKAETIPKLKDYYCKNLLRKTDCRTVDSDEITKDTKIISLAAIIYGSMTAAGTDEAYLTYFSGFGTHAEGYGGGILFKRIGRQWRLIKWFPGGQMDECVALPGHGPQSMLCLSGYEGQGEKDSSTWIERVTKTRKGLSVSREAVAKAQDQRDTIDIDEPDSYPCALGGTAHKAMLLSIHDLRRSSEPGIFAASKITYATADSVYSACSQNHFEKVKTEAGVIRYAIRNGKITAITPLKFSKPDY